jgi:hypothetical protein
MKRERVLKVLCPVTPTSQPPDRTHKNLSTDGRTALTVCKIMAA